MGRQKVGSGARIFSTAAYGTASLQSCAVEYAITKRAMQTLGADLSPESSEADGQGAAEVKVPPIRFLFPGMRDWAPTPPPTEQERTAEPEPDDRLSTFLLTSLQMQHLSVLAGSGTSFGVGGPTMADLWAACVPTPIGDETLAVLKKLRYGEADAERNIEELLSRCDAQLQVTPDDGAVASFREQAVSTILRRCHDVGVAGVHDMGAHKEFLRRLARRRARDPRLKVFTTNYDLCFERAAGDLGLVALDGFSFSQPRRFDPGFFDYDIVRRSTASTDGPNYVPGVFQYFKLHGSVDWALNGKGGVAIDRDVDAPRACLVYPTQQKYRFSFQQPHLELVAQFLATLRQANSCLLTVGFGFRDDHLSEPIFSALESNPHLRVIVVTPRAEAHLSVPPSDAWKRLRTLFEQGTDVAFIQATFPMLVPVIPDLRALTPGERLERAVLGAVQAP
jgi:hypothetical protein